MYDVVILLGVVTSILFFELTGLSPAGLIVPGYIVLSLRAPLRVACTLAAALAAAGLVRLLSRVTILYGRRRFAALVLLAYGLHALVTLTGVLPFRTDVIGCLVPGIIARDFDRQGVVKTLLSLAVVTALLALVLALAGYPVV